MAWRKADGKTTSFPSAFHGPFLSTASFDMRSGNRLKIGRLIGKPIPSVCSAACAAVHRFQNGTIHIGREDYP
jgi:hypothetical protein